MSSNTETLSRRHADPRVVAAIKDLIGLPLLGWPRLPLRDRVACSVPLWESDHSLRRDLLDTPDCYSMQSSALNRKHRQKGTCILDCQPLLPQLFTLAKYDPLLASGYQESDTLIPKVPFFVLDHHASTFPQTFMLSVHVCLVWAGSASPCPSVQLSPPCLLSQRASCLIPGPTALPTWPFQMGRQAGSKPVPALVTGWLVTE